MAARRITARTRIYRLRITLLDVRPPIWRRILIPGDATLAEVHETIQHAMGWTNSHLHEFDIRGRRYGMPDPDWDNGEVDEATVTLGELVDGGENFRYTYDFGDNWRHEIHAEQVTTAEIGTQYPRCTAGQRACPPEDVGGPGGYEEFILALTDPGHEQRESYLEWIGGPFNAAEFQLEQTNDALRSVTWMTAIPGK
jgi:hypothetical protein